MLLIWMSDMLLIKTGQIFLEETYKFKHFLAFHCDEVRKQLILT